MAGWEDLEGDESLSLSGHIYTPGLLTPLNVAVYID